MGDALHIVAWIRYRKGEDNMYNIFIQEIDDKIKIYNDGVLIMEETGYNKVVLIINKLKDIIQDMYQLNVLNEVLKIVELRGVA